MNFEYWLIDTNICHKWEITKNKAFSLFNEHGAWRLTRIERYLKRHKIFNLGGGRYIEAVFDEVTA